MNAILASLFEIPKLLDGRVFNGRVRLFKSTQSGMTTVPEDQWMVEHYFPNINKDEDEIYFDCPHALHYHGFE